jgi:hypothetical protein
VISLQCDLLAQISKDPHSNLGMLLAVWWMAALKNGHTYDPYAGRGVRTQAPESWSWMASSVYCSFREGSLDLVNQTGTFSLAHRSAASAEGVSINMWLRAATWRLPVQQPGHWPRVGAVHCLGLRLAAACVRAWPDVGREGHVGQEALVAAPQLGGMQRGVLRQHAPRGWG